MNFTTQPCLMPLGFVTISSSFPLCFLLVPCAPQNVSASLVCLNRSALVMWSGSASAVMYTVKLEATGSRTHHCQSNSTRCQLDNISCGEIYTATVTPHSETCAGQPSQPFMFNAGAEGIEIKCLTHRKRSGVYFFFSPPSAGSPQDSVLPQ